MGRYETSCEAQVVLCNDRHSTQTTVLVAADLNHAALIGWQDLQKLRVIPASFPAVAAVAQCFKDIKQKHWTHSQVHFLTLWTINL